MDKQNKKDDKKYLKELNENDIFTVCVPFLTYYQAEALMLRYPGSYIMRKKDSENDQSDRTID